MSASDASNDDNRPPRAGQPNSNAFDDISDDDSDGEGFQNDSFNRGNRSSTSHKEASGSEDVSDPDNDQSGGDSEREDDEVDDEGDFRRGSRQNSRSGDDSDRSREFSERGGRSFSEDLDTRGLRDDRAPALRSTIRPPAYRRTIVELPTRKEPVSLVHMPPTIDVPLLPTDPTRDDLQGDCPYSILYRLRSDVRGSDVERAVSEYGAARAMRHVAESNTRLLTWSDGSRTLMVGDEHFAVTDDKVVPPSMYIFRKGNEVQSYHAKVGHVAVVQPSTVSRKRAALSVGPTAGLAQKKGRVMLREMDGGAEREEQAALSTYHARMREQARLDAKRRKMAEKQIRPEQKLSRAGLESDEESDDEAMLENHRRLEEEREARLRASKRAAAERHEALQRRKLGARRVLSDGEDDDE